MSDALVGRTALVTGAGRGIGRAIALGLAAATAPGSLFSLDRSTSLLKWLRP